MRTAYDKSWIILCLIRVNPFVGITVRGVCTTRDTVIFNSLSIAKNYTRGMKLQMHDQTATLARGSESKAGSTAAESRCLKWCKSLTLSTANQFSFNKIWWIDVFQRCQLWEISAAFRNWLVSTRWRQQGLRTNTHAPAQSTACNASTQELDNNGGSIDHPRVSTLTNDITVVCFRYVITKESPCSVSAATINPDTVAFICGFGGSLRTQLWRWTEWSSIDYTFTYTASATLSCMFIYILHVT